MADGDWSWMTPGECAEWWNGIFQQKANEVAIKASEVPYVGFYVSWASYSLADATNLLFLDNLKLGEGMAEAWENPNGRGVLGRSLCVVTDLGRAAFFIPVGRLAKGAGTVERTGARSIPTAVEDAARAPHPTPPAPAGVVPRVAGRSAVYGDAVAKSAWPEVNAFFRRMFYFVDPASSEGICWFVAMGQALRHTGRYWIKLDDMLALFPNLLKGADAANWFKSIANVEHFGVQTMTRYLNQLNVAHKHLQKVTSIAQLYERAGKNLNGAILFQVNYLNEGKWVGHIMYMARKANGKLAIYDRSGLVVESFQEMEAIARTNGWKGYYGIGGAHLAPNDMPILVYNARIVETTTDMLKGGLGLGVFGALALEIKVINAYFNSGR